MGRLRVILAAAIVALIAAPGAGAAVWQGPVPISDAAFSAWETPRISIGASGDAAAVWWDDAAGGRVLLARRPAGGAWSTPAAIGDSASPLTALTGVDGAGNVTAVWSNSVGTVTTIATWPAAAPAPSLTTLNQVDDTMTFQPALISELVVNPSGTAIMTGKSGMSNLAMGYRTTATGAFAFSLRFGISSVATEEPHIALNDAGSGVVIYRSGNTIWASRLSAAVGSFGPSDAVNAGLLGATSPQDLSVAIDQAGDILIGFTMAETGGMGSRAVGTAWRSPTGDWTPQWPLSTVGALATFTATNTSVAVNRSGTAILAWTQAGATPLDSSASARIGSSLTGAFGPIERINDVGVYAPSVAIADDGTIAASWEQDTTGGARIGQARARTPAGVWGDTRTLDPPHLADTEPVMAGDGHGHFATVTSPDAGGTKQVLVSFLDTVAPAVSPVALAGSALAGDPLSLSVTASDKWSAIPTIAWNFGDGASGTGLAASHTYASAGAYTASVAVTDAAGNTATGQVVIAVAAKQSTLTTAKFAAKWKQSRVKGSLLVIGTAPRAGSYAVDVTKGTTRKIHASFDLPAGAFSKTIKLPAKLLPGNYHVALTPSFPATQVKPAGRDAKLAAPVTGVVDNVALSGKLNGPATGTLRNLNTVYATFHFAAVPRGKLTVSWFLTVKGKRTRLGSASKSPAVKVGSFALLGGKRGKVTAVISRKGVVIAQASVKVL
jgi:PKD repeat protein